MHPLLVLGRVLLRMDTLDTLPCSPTPLLTPTFVCTVFPFARANRAHVIMTTERVT